jgi:hypothetical protein
MRPCYAAVRMAGIAFLAERFLFSASGLRVQIN